MQTEPCHALVCDRPRMKKGGGRYCRRHAGCALADAFGAALCEKIAALPGAVRESFLGDDHGWRFTLTSKVGPLYVSFHDGTYALFARFEEPKLANKLLGGKGLLNDTSGVNPYSGKWNHHITDGHPVETAVLYVMNQLQRVL